MHLDLPATHLLWNDISYHHQRVCGRPAQHRQRLDGDRGLQLPRPKRAGGGLPFENLTFEDELFSSQVGQLPLQAGDDAGAIQWMPLNKEVLFNRSIMHCIFCDGWIVFITLDYMQVVLYASHKDFVEKVVDKLGAHW